MRRRREASDVGDGSPGGRPIGWVVSSMSARLQTFAGVLSAQLCRIQVSRW
jgi:hypothetical protein